MKSKLITNPHFKTLGGGSELLDRIRLLCKGLNSDGFGSVFTPSSLKEVCPTASSGNLVEATTSPLRLSVNVASYCTSDPLDQTCVAELRGRLCHFETTLGFRLLAVVSEASGAVTSASSCMLFTYSLFHLTVAIPGEVIAQTRIKQTTDLLALLLKNKYEVGRSLKDRANLLLGGRLPANAAASAPPGVAGPQPPPPAVAGPQPAVAGPQPATGVAR